MAQLHIIGINYKIIIKCIVYIQMDAWNRYRCSWICFLIIGMFNLKIIFAWDEECYCLKIIRDVANLIL